MIKIVHFNISLKLKQKYLFEKLYFLKIYHFLLTDTFLHISSNVDLRKIISLSFTKNNSEGGLISHNFISVNTESVISISYFK